MAIDANDYPNKIKANLWANKSYTIFYYNFVLEKKRFRGLVDLSDKIGWGKRDKISVAEAELIKVKNAKKDGVLSDKTILNELVEKYFDFLPNTSYKKVRQSHYIRYVKPLIGNKQVTAIRQLHIKDAIKDQENQGLAARTVKQTIEVLSPVFKTAIANRLIVHNPLDGIKIKLPKTKKIVTDASNKLVEIYKAIVEEFAHDPFYQALFLFALQGRRKSEILNLKWEDVNLEQNYYVLRNTKNDEEQKIFLPERIKDLLVQLDQSREYVFTSRRTGQRTINIEKTTARLKKQLGSGFGLHYLRNVIVSAMAEQGLDSIHLSSALGHNDPNTITKYLTLNYLKGSELASGVIDGIVQPKE